MFLNPLTENFIKINQARFILQTISVIFLVVVVYGQVFANEDLSLLAAAKNGNQELVVSLINNGEDVNQVDDSGYTPLMWAARYNYMEISRLLVGAGARIGIKNNSGLDAPKIAIRFNNFKIARYLTDTYSPAIEKMVNVKKDDPALMNRVSDSNQDGYLDPVAGGSSMAIVSGQNESESLIRKIKIILHACSQDKEYKIISARIGLAKSKWQDIKQINSTTVTAKRKGYFIVLKFSYENDSEVVELHYIDKQGSYRTLKRIAKRVSKLYRFLCAVPESTDGTNIEEQRDKILKNFELSGCDNQRYTATAIVLVSLRKNRWKNIQITNGRNISAEYITDTTNYGALIEFSKNWQAGIINIGSTAATNYDAISQEEEETYVISVIEIKEYQNKYLANINKRISRLYRLHCNQN